MAHSDSRLRTTSWIWLNFLRRWELKTIFTGSSARRSEQTLTIRLGLPGLSGFLPRHLIQLTTRYILVKTEMTWEQAKAHCRSSYTDLVSVRNSTENALVSSLVSQKTWIGLHRKNWDYWSDQSPVTFTNWSSNQPDKRGNSMELCAVVNTTTGTWSVVDCSSKHYFICENVKFRN
uniref:C-type lectin domain-containing protein n=1 Tax=Mola mola TaxID=94237 RepID=A0A3Q4BZI3_MOLML